MKSPFSRRFRGGRSTPGTVAALRALASRLATVSANASSAGAAVSAVVSSGYSVWAVPTSDRLAERLQATTATPAAGQFRLVDGVLGERPFQTSRGAGVPEQAPWSAMAFWDGTQFRGILVWLWTGQRMLGDGTLVDDLPVTDPASQFYPVLPDNQFRHVQPVVIDASGAITLAGASNTGVNFSSAQQAGPGGSWSTSFFSADDGVWGIHPGRGVDGDTPGPFLTTGSYGFINANAGEPVSQYFWGGAAQTSSNAVAVVFSA